MTDQLKTTPIEDFPWEIRSSLCRVRLLCLRAQAAAGGSVRPDQVERAAELLVDPLGDGSIPVEDVEPIAAAAVHDVAGVAGVLGSDLFGAVDHREMRVKKAPDTSPLMIHLL